MLNLIDLHNKHVLVTGASSGIGKEVSIQLSRLGANVSMVARSYDKLNDVITQLEGSGHHFYPFDLCQIDGISGLMLEVVKNGGALDGFVHCAGITVNRPLRMFRYEEEHRVMLTNFYSFLEISKNITKKNYFNAGLSIVAISSISSTLCRASQITYSASKAALNAAVKCMALELSSKKVRVNAILPAMIKTQMYEEHKSRYNRDDDFFKKGGAIGAGEPTDVANLIAFLLSDASKFITRDEIELTGGYYGQL